MYTFVDKYTYVDMYICICRYVDSYIIHVYICGGSFEDCCSLVRLRCRHVYSNSPVVAITWLLLVGASIGDIRGSCMYMNVDGFGCVQSPCAVCRYGVVLVSRID